MPSGLEWLIGLLQERVGPVNVSRWLHLGDESAKAMLEKSCVSRESGGVLETERDELSAAPKVDASEATKSLTRLFSEAQSSRRPLSRALPSSPSLFPRRAVSGARYTVLDQ